MLDLIPVVVTSVIAFIALKLSGTQVVTLHKGFRSLPFTSSRHSANNGPKLDSLLEKSKAYPKQTRGAVKKDTDSVTDIVKDLAISHCALGYESFLPQPVLPSRLSAEMLATKRVEPAYERCNAEMLGQLVLIVVGMQIVYRFVFKRQPKVAIQAAPQPESAASAWNDLSVTEAPASIDVVTDPMMYWQSIANESKDSLIEPSLLSLGEALSDLSLGFMESQSYGSEIGELNGGHDSSDMCDSSEMPTDKGETDIVLSMTSELLCEMSVISELPCGVASEFIDLSNQDRPSNHELPSNQEIPSNHEPLMDQELPVDHTPPIDDPPPIDDLQPMSHSKPNDHEELNDPEEPNEHERLPNEVPSVASDISTGVAVPDSEKASASLGATSPSTSVVSHTCQGVIDEAANSADPPRQVLATLSDSSLNVRSNSSLTHSASHSRAASNSLISVSQAELLNYAATGESTHLSDSEVVEFGISYWSELRELMDQSDPSVYSLLIEPSLILSDTPIETAAKPTQADKCKVQQAQQVQPAKQAQVNPEVNPDEVIPDNVTDNDSEYIALAPVSPVSAVLPPSATHESVFASPASQATIAATTAALYGEVVSRVRGIRKTGVLHKVRSQLVPGAPLAQKSVHFALDTPFSLQSRPTPELQAQNPTANSDIITGMRADIARIIAKVNVAAPAADVYTATRAEHHSLLMRTRQFVLDFYVAEQDIEQALVARMRRPSQLVEQYKRVFLEFAGGNIDTVVRSYELAGSLKALANTVPAPDVDDVRSSLEACHLTIAAKKKIMKPSETDLREIWDVWEIQYAFETTTAVMNELFSQHVTPSLGDLKARLEQYGRAINADNRYNESVEIQLQKGWTLCTNVLDSSAVLAERIARYFEINMCLLEQAKGPFPPFIIGNEALFVLYEQKSLPKLKKEVTYWAARLLELMDSESALIVSGLIHSVLVPVEKNR